VANDARTAFVAEDGGWGGHVQLNEHPAVGMGDSKEEAIADLRRGIECLVEYLSDTGQPVPADPMNFVNIEVAA
jgi:predicted RNase H-like HicB family nuclease